MTSKNRRSRTGRVVISACAGVLAVGLSACTVDTSGSSGDSAGSGSHTAADQENTVHQGHRFRLGDFVVKRGWRITKNPYVGYTVEHLRVKNVTGDSHSFFVDVRLYRSGKNQVADINCNTGEINPGVTATNVNCLPDGSAKHRFTKITFANSF